MDANTVQGFLDILPTASPMRGSLKTMSRCMYQISLFVVCKKQRYLNRVSKLRLIQQKSKNPKIELKLAIKKPNLNMRLVVVLSL
jgi:hypothetical protein